MVDARAIPRNRIIGGRIIERPRSVTAAPATILAYPMARRREVLVAVTSAAMLRTRSPDGADRVIGRALHRFMAEMKALQVPVAVIHREVHALEYQVRAAVWRAMFPWVDANRTRRSRQVDGRRRRPPAPPKNQLTFNW
jgi:hypothetical protein